MADRALWPLPVDLSSGPEPDEDILRWPFRLLPAAALLIDHRERVLAVSDAWLEMTGYRRDEVMGRMSSSLLSLESARLAAMEVIPDLRSKGRADAAVLQVRVADGDLLSVDCDARMIPHGRAFRVLAAMTPRAGLRAGLDDYADATGDWFWETDADLRLRWISRNIEARTGRPASWFLGRRVDELGFPELDAEHRRRLARREPYAGFVYRARGPDGPAWCRSSGRPVFAGDGRFLGYRGAVADVTAEVEAREAAEVARDRLQATLEAAEETYAIWDADDRLVTCNDRYRAMAGTDVDAVRPGMSFEEITRRLLANGAFPSARGREATWLARRLELHRQPGPPFELELSDRRWILVREQKIAGGETVSAATDVSLLKQQQHSLREALAAAEQANAQRAAFMAQMSHELRTPMNAVLGFAEVLESQLHGPLGDARYRDYVGHIHDSGQHLLGLINDLLDIAKIESGALTLREEPLELRAMIAAAIELIAPIAARKHVALIAPAGPPTWVSADRRALHQVLTNLLSSGVKLAGDGGRVHVVVGDDDGGGLCVSVTDTGHGIPAEHLGHVWQPFAAVEDRLLSRPFLGTGLGLSVVRNLMQMHGGDAALTSEVGVGTEVRITFPPNRRLHPDRQLKTP